MHTHKWLSNSTTVLNEIPIQNRACQLELNKSNLLSMKTLGVLWVANEDVSTFKARLSEKEVKPTKRNVLKRIGTLLDPHGFCHPLLLQPKYVCKRYGSLE